MKEWIALALLLLLAVGAIVNIAYLDRLIGDIEAVLRETDELARDGSYEEALDSLDRAIRHWLDANAYTHIFIRHPEIDSTSDAFYELHQALAEQNAEGYPSALEKLCYHLHSIDEMEHVRPGSVL
ncbi:MAG: DUF4363 family protein [Oscillospiraceae bacterium]|nr:DUF4363 family protein [Oscillospiraceae bacterium]